MQTEQKKFAEHRRFLTYAIALCTILPFVVQGCGKPSRETWQDVDTEAETVIVLEEDEEPKIRMEDVCLELYREAGRSGPEKSDRYGASIRGKAFLQAGDGSAGGTDRNG